MPVRSLFHFFTPGGAMADIPNTEEVGHATTWFTTQAGITATVLAFVAIVLAVFVIYLIRKHEKERIEWLTKIETMRKEEWTAIDNLMELTSDAQKALEERRRQDTNGHFAKLDGVLNEVKSMSVGDERHHARVEAKVAEVAGALGQQSARLGDMINLATMIAPASPPARGRRRG